MNVKIEASWNEQLTQEFHKDYFVNLTSFIKEEKTNYKIYPSGKNIFNAFYQCPFDKVKLVILGQDPYHGYGQAHGLCFSVPNEIPPPPSIQNIFKEIQTDLNISIPKSGNLERWARQGILLLNATLTVRSGVAGSHQNKGWEEFTDSVIQLISDKKENIVFILWGSYAQKKGLIIDSHKHLILKSAHPSPFSVNRGFFGSKHFSKANNYLQKHRRTPINW